MRPTKQDTDSSQYYALLARLERLEKAADNDRRVVIVSGVSSVYLGAVDGENITGVRLSMAGRINVPGANAIVRLRPNGLASVSTNALAHRTWWPSGGPATSDLQWGAQVAAQAGLIMGSSDWNRNCTFTARGTFYTALQGVGRRHWDGSYTNQDVQIDGNNVLRGAIMSQWNDTVTPVTSLTLALDSGTFSGRIAVEMLP